MSLNIASLSKKSIFSKKAIAKGMLVILSTSVFSAQAKDLNDINTFPAWFQESLKREVELKQNSDLSIEQYGIKAKVLGKYQQVESEEGILNYQIDIGTQAPVECFVFSEFDGPATSL